MSCPLLSALGAILYVFVNPRRAICFSKLSVRQETFTWDFCYIFYGSRTCLSVNNLLFLTSHYECSIFEVLPFCGGFVEICWGRLEFSQEGFEITWDIS